ncbi:hypothetical protein [Paracidovorax cattleyae]|nr:hypothetical protein [Paracidovorax cattleyae]MBF9263397.1 hypothetical protein [Paracidovorax cattleyae]
MLKLLSLWLFGLVLLAPHPSVLLWAWVFAPAVVVPAWLLHCLTSRR